MHVEQRKQLEGLSNGSSHCERQDFVPSIRSFSTSYVKETVLLKNSRISIMAAGGVVFIACCEPHRLRSRKV